MLFCATTHVHKCYHCFMKNVMAPAFNTFSGNTSPHRSHMRIIDPCILAPSKKESTNQ